MINATKNFRDSPHSKTWLDLVDSAQFQAAASAAIIEMQTRNTAPPDLATAASFAWKLEGAKQFLTILCGLTAPAPEKSFAPTQNLNHAR